MKMMKLSCLGLLLIILANSLLWTGCSEDPPVFPDPPDPVEKLTVTVWPADGATDVACDVMPTFTFSPDLNGEMPVISIVRQSNRSEVNHSLVKVSSTLYRVEFPQLLAEGEIYERYLFKAIGKNGETLRDPVPQITVFTTHVGVAIPPLVLSAVSPLPGEEISHETATLMYSADYALDPATVGPAYTLTNTTSGMQVLASVVVTGKDIDVIVDGLLEHSSSYSATFNPDIIRGVNGEKPNSVYSFSFTTEVVIPPPVFTTPEGYLQYAGTYKDGYIFVGGIGPNDEGFTACFDQNGEEVWLETFKINGKYTRVLYMAATQNELYSILEVKSDPGSPGSGEVWLYSQDRDGIYLNKWQRTSGSKSFSITSSEAEVFILYSLNFGKHIDRFSSSGLQSSIILDYSTDLLFHNGYLYIAGGIYPNGDLFITKWNSDLTDSLWYRAEPIPGALSYGTTNLTFASDRLQLLGNSTIPSVKFALRQYTENGDMIAELEITGDVGDLDYCSDNTYTYALGLGQLQRIDVNGNVTHIDWINGSRVFSINIDSGSNLKIAVTDKTNNLKLYDSN